LCNGGHPTDLSVEAISLIDTQNGDGVGTAKLILVSDSSPKENLITAIEIAGTRRNGEPVIQEVAILFDSKLMRGNRTYKFSTENFDAFSSPNFDELAEIGIHILYNYPILLRPQGELKVHKKFDAGVGVMKIFPGMSQDFVKAALNTPNIQSIILETYGSGNAPKDPAFIALLEDTIARGITVLNVTQCSKGFVEQGLYATSAALQKIGVIGGADMTTEAALTKLMFLMGQGFRGDSLKLHLTTPLRGELTSYVSLGLRAV
jgi:L-asparaginase